MREFAPTLARKARSSRTAAPKVSPDATAGRNGGLPRYLQRQVINQPSAASEHTDGQATHAGQANATSGKLDDESEQESETRGRSGSEFGPTAGAMIRMRTPGFTHPVAAALARPGVRFRLPTFGKVKAAYTDPDLKIPEKVIQARVTQLLNRMEREGRLKSTETVATIVGKIFPSPGVMDEAEFNKAVDVNDRTQIYQSVAESDTKVKPVDKPKLQVAMNEAADLVKKVEGDAAGLTQVFGTKDSVAKSNYGKAEKALKEVSKNIDAHVTTDYNLDDPEVGLGGTADFDTQTMHLLLKVAQVSDAAKAKTTIIHEASHLADPSVDDQVYYGGAGFFELDEANKVANAAHYEELPRRKMGTSMFDKKTFTPGVTVGGGAVTRPDKIKADANRYIRKAWDAGVDMHTFIRGVRREYQGGNKKPFDDHKALILEISKLIDLTVHEQAAGKQIVTTLDVTLSESVARGVKFVKEYTASVPFPALVVPPLLPFSDIELRDQIIATALMRYGNLLRDAARDKALLDWLEAHYRSLPVV
ncbi:MAG TPA: hypothetical protein VGW39_14165 [Chthoniobacterales bacterium]|nr:hypothetical protein [Chthoniobacterales bacterium]